MKDQSLISKVKEELTIETFKPTEKMLRWLEAALDPGVKATAADISRATNINVNTWRTWRESPTFIKWWNEKWNEAQRNLVWQLDKIGWDRAKKDFKYWEALQIKFGGLKKTVELESGGQPFSAGIFVVDFKKQLRGEDVEVRTITKSNVVEGEIVPANGETKRATAALESTKTTERTSHTSELAQINPLANKDLEFPKEEKEYVTKTEMKKNGWRPGKITEEATRYFVRENHRSARIAKNDRKRADRKKYYKELKAKIASEKAINPVEISESPATVDKSVSLDGEKLPKLSQLG